MSPTGIFLDISCKCLVEYSLPRHVLFLLALWLWHSIPTHEGLAFPLAYVLIRWHQSGRLPVWIATSAILWVLASVYSITTEVPINNRVASWDETTAHPDWKTFRNRWDLHHRWRVALLTVAFAFLIVGVIGK
jgi:uncharacterized membrane protein